MKVLVVSDTHGRIDKLKKILKKEKPVDVLIHCGDVEGDEEQIRCQAECPCYFVRGNNDYFSDLPQEEMLMLGDYKIMVTHGHMYGVSIDTSALEEEARSRGVQVVMFGHTHRPFLKEKDGLTILNPGSVSYPRQEGKKSGYLIMKINENGEAFFEQNYLNEFWDY